MKTILFALTLLVSSYSFAGSCKLTSSVYDGWGCYSIGTKLDVPDLSMCETMAKNTQENRFFNLLEKKDVLLRTKLQYKDKAQKLKVKKTIDFAPLDDCGGLPG